MNPEEELFKKRLADLAGQAYQRNICTFTGFLGLMEMSLFWELSKELSYVKYTAFGGADFCERQIIRFGEIDTPFPIHCIHITPSLKKFSDDLTHRDFLGSLMNLGIKREVLGDIIVNDREAYVFCLESISDFILQNMTRIKHTSVRCSLTSSVPEEAGIHLAEKEYNVASLRLDAIISEICHLSRSQAQLVIREKKAFINGRLTENNSGLVKPGDLITVRGFGRFLMGDSIRPTKKGRYFITLLIYSQG